MPACLYVLMKHMAHSMLTNRGSGRLATIALAQSSQNVTEYVLHYHQDDWKPPTEHIAGLTAGWSLVDINLW